MAEQVLPQAGVVPMRAMLFSHAAEVAVIRLFSKHDEFHHRLLVIYENAHSNTMGTEACEWL